MSLEHLWPLPGTWSWVRFEDVAKVCSDLRDPSASPEALHIAPNHIESATGRLLGRGTVAGDKVISPKHAFHSGQILYSKIRPYLAKVVLVDFDGLCSADMYPVEALPDRIGPRFLHRWLLSRAFTSVASESQGRTVLPKINQEALYQKPVPLAPLPEQKRIADKLDALLARVDACRQRLDRVPAILKRFRQSVLAAATSGELTREWREKRTGTSEPTWRTAPLFTLCIPSRIITYGVIKLGNEIPGGVPCLRTSDVRWLRIDTSFTRRIAASLSAEYRRTVLQGGEVLVNVRGTLGGVAVADESMRGWNVSREVAVVPVDPVRVRPEYLAFWIGADASQRWLARVEKGVAYTGINIEDLRALPVAVPPLDEQDEAVRRVKAFLELSEALELRSRAAAERVSRLTPALLAKAFRGELVPQDPNDEPASVLLERIRAAAASAEVPTKPTRIPRRPSRIKPAPKEAKQGAARRKRAS